VVNPAAGSGRTARMWPRLGEELRRLGLEFESAETRRLGHATALAREAVGAGWPLVVAVGGDGTLNEVVNGVTDAHGTPLATTGAILTGRGRDACRNLGLAPDWALAARRPARVATLTVIGSPPPLRKGAERIPALTEEFETRGVEHWARRTMAGRLGDRFPAEGVEWWIKFMGGAPLSTLIGFNARINYSDIRADLPKIACPTLVITTHESGLASVEETRAWQETIRDSELLVIPGNSYHVAASHAERCAEATLEFIARRGAGQP